MERIKKLYDKEPTPTKTCTCKLTHQLRTDDLEFDQGLTVVEFLPSPMKSLNVLSNLSGPAIRSRLTHMGSPPKGSRQIRLTQFSHSPWHSAHSGQLIQGTHCPLPKGVSRRDCALVLVWLVVTLELVRMGIASLPNILIIFELFVGYERVAISVVMGIAVKVC